MTTKTIYVPAAGYELRLRHRVTGAPRFLAISLEQVPLTYSQAWQLLRQICAEGHAAFGISAGEYEHWGRGSVRRMEEDDLSTVLG